MGFSSAATSCGFFLFGEDYKNPSIPSAFQRLHLRSPAGQAGDLSPSVSVQNRDLLSTHPGFRHGSLRQNPSGAWTASSIHIASFRGDSSLPPPRKMENAFARPVDQVLSTLGVQASAGLTDAQVKKLTEKHGKNGRFASCRKTPGAEC